MEIFGPFIRRALSETNSYYFEGRAYALRAYCRIFCETVSEIKIPMSLLKEFITTLYNIFGEALENENESFESRKVNLFFNKVT